MRKLLLQLDSSRLPSVFDRVVAYDGGADEVMSYGGIVEGDVRDLVHGCIFTRGPKDLKNTAGFIGGSDMAAGERLLAAAQQAFFGLFRVSLMLDSNGSNTTAVAAVEKMVRTAGEVRGQRVLIVAGTGPVGIRAAGLFARAGAEVVLTSRRPEAGERARDLVVQRFGGTVRAVTLPDASQAIRACERATLLLNAGPAGAARLHRRPVRLRSPAHARAASDRGGPAARVSRRGGGTRRYRRPAGPGPGARQVDASRGVHARRDPPALGAGAPQG